MDLFRLRQVLDLCFLSMTTHLSGMILGKLSIQMIIPSRMRTWTRLWWWVCTCAHQLLASSYRIFFLLNNLFVFSVMNVDLCIKFFLLCSSQKLYLLRSPCCFGTIWSNCWKIRKFAPPYAFGYIFEFWWCQFNKQYWLKCSWITQDIYYRC